MSEEASQKTKTSKRSKRKAAMEPLGWDEIVSQPGMGGYLSFLNGPVPLPHLQGSEAADSTPGPPSGAVSESGAASGAPVIDSPPQVFLHPEIISTPASSNAPAPVSSPDPEPESDTVSVSTIVSETAPTQNLADPGPVSTPAPYAPPVSFSGRRAQASNFILDAGLNEDPGVVLNPRHNNHLDLDLTTEVISLPAVNRIRIRRCAAAHDGHSLGEEVLYQALWKAAAAESDIARIIVVGWRGMSQLCRMTPKNCKINTQRLIRKLALEVLSPYNTPESIGTTYRVFAAEEIL